MTILKKVLGWVVRFIAYLAVIVEFPVTALIIVLAMLVDSIAQLCTDLATLRMILPTALSAFADHLTLGKSFSFLYTERLDSYSEVLADTINKVRDDIAKKEA